MVEVLVCESLCTTEKIGKFTNSHGKLPIRYPSPNKQSLCTSGSEKVGAFCLEALRIRLCHVTLLHG